MSSLATVLALVFLSSLSVARADLLQCDLTIGDTNVCSWVDDHKGVIFSAVCSAVALLLFMVLNIYSSMARPTAPATPMSYAPRDQPQVPPQPVVAGPPSYAVSATQSYAFSAPNAGWQSSAGPQVPDKEWTNVDLSRDGYSPYARPVQSARPAYY